MGLLKGLLACLLGVTVLLPQVSCVGTYKNCVLETPFDLVRNNEPEGSPLALSVDMLITGLTEVAVSGGSYSVDVE